MPAPLTAFSLVISLPLAWPLSSVLRVASL
ncbi:Uncharacterised protein [Bordetella pertussis]|nr:Uncharacterised protein [Bordetella pertussis]